MNRFKAEERNDGLYVSWPALDGVIADKVIPLWQIVYHGIILYNSTTDTVNYTIKKPMKNINHLCTCKLNLLKIIGKSARMCLR